MEESGADFYPIIVKWDVKDGVGEWVDLYDDAYNPTHFIVLPKPRIGLNQQTGVAPNV